MTDRTELLVSGFRGKQSSTRYTSWPAGNGSHTGRANAGQHPIPHRCAVGDGFLCDRGKPAAIRRLARRSPSANTGRCPSRSSITASFGAFPGALPHGLTQPLRGIPAIMQRLLSGLNLETIFIATRRCHVTRGPPRGPVPERLPATVLTAARPARQRCGPPHGRIRCRSRSAAPAAPHCGRVCAFHQTLSMA